MRGRSWGGALWAALAVLAAACAGPGPTTVTEPGAPGGRTDAAPKRIVAVALAEPATFSAKVNAVQIPAPGADVLEDLVSAGFTYTDDRGVLSPLLAEAVPTLENGLWRLLADGRMETTWRLKPAARWHDGAPFAAEDVVFSARLGQDRELALFREASFDVIESVEASDPHTVVVRWARPFIEADLLFNKNLLPKHLLERAYVEDRATFTELPHWNQEFIGTGPYKLRQWAVGSHVVLDASPDYVFGRPKIDEIELRFVPDPTTAISNILSGAVDLTFGRGYSIEQAVQIRDQWREGRVDLGFINTWHALFPQFINPNPTMILDVRARRALMHAIDRESMAETIQHGLVTVSHSFLGPNQPQYQEIEARLPRYEYDSRKATQMIESLGYTRAGDGMFRDPAAQKPTVEIRTTHTDYNLKIMITVADYWQRAGLAVDTVSIPPQRFRDQEYVATFPGFVLFRNPIDVRRLKALHSRQTPLPENNYRITGNNARYMNAEFDALIDRFHVTVSMAERTQVLGQILYHIADQLPVMGLFYDPEPVFISNRLEKAGGKTLRSTQAWNVHEWTLR